MKPEHEELCARLDGYNPPDRTFDDQRQASTDIHDAAAAIRELSAEVATYRPFFIKHAIGPKARPSCLCCGRNNYEDVAVQHLELPGIVVCDQCKRAEAELAKVKWHAEAIARGYELLDEDDLETVDAINNAVLDYRADYPRGE